MEDAEFGVAHHVTAEVVEDTLALAGKANGWPCSAVLITSPTYYGACSNAAGGPPCGSDVLQQAGSRASLCFWAICIGALCSIPTLCLRLICPAVKANTHTCSCCRHS